MITSVERNKAESFLYEKFNLVIVMLTIVAGTAEVHHTPHGAIVTPLRRLQFYPRPQPRSELCAACKPVDINRIRNINVTFCFKYYLFII